MKEQGAQIRAALERAQIITGWPETAVSEVIADAEIRIFGDRERVVAGGDVVDSMWVIVEGAFIQSRSWENGRRFLYTYLKFGQTTGMLSVFDRLPAPFDVTARGGGVAIALSGRAVRSVALRFPEVAMQLIGRFCQGTRTDYEAIELHAMNSVRCRIAKAILWIAKGQADAEGREFVVESRISQEDLADTVCAARQSVNRELRRMMKEGILKQRYRTLVILDRERLTKVAEEDEDLPHAPAGRAAAIADGHVQAAD
jgi:CRP/FNR family cyclic AMP-dependent transcriptional regulator